MTVIFADTLMTVAIVVIMTKVIVAILVMKAVMPVKTLIVLSKAHEVFSTVVMVVVTVAIGEGIGLMAVLIDTTEILNNFKFVKFIFQI